MRAFGDAISVDLESDFASTEADAILEDDLGGRGCCHFLIGSFNGGIGLHADGHGLLGGVDGVCCDRGAIVGGVCVGSILGFQARIGS